MNLQLGRGDLVLSYSSLPSGTPFEVRVAAAAEAGFAGIGWHVREYAVLPSSPGRDADVLAVLDAYGVVLHEIDALSLDGLALLDDAVHLARLAGVHHIQVQGDRPGPVEDAAKTIASIADRVGPDGVAVAIEFIGCTNIADASDALDLAERSQRDNVGLQIDVWHHVRGANEWALLELIPVERICSVQLDDGPWAPIDPDYIADTIHHRRVPGAGQFDLDRFLDVVYRPGVNVPLSLEVIDDNLLALTPKEAARRIAGATTTFLARRGGGAPPEWGELLEPGRPD